MATDGHNETVREDKRLKDLKQRRENVIKRLKRFDEFMSSVSSETSIEELIFRRTKSDEIYSDYKTLQTQIEEIDLSATQHWIIFEKLYYSAVAKCNECINDHPKNKTLQHTNQPIAQCSNQIPLELPTIELPTFHGGYQHWPSFANLFRSLVHQNERLRNIDKLHYLLLSVKGEALSTINTLEITDANYQIAWSILKEKYENRREIIREHVQQVIKQPQIIKSNYKQLKQLYESTERNVNSLEALGLDVKNNDIFLVGVIENKLDSFTLQQWKTEIIKHKIAQPTYNDLRTFLNQRLAILNMSDDKLTMSRPSTITAKSTPRALFANSNEKCPVCDQPHPIYFCSEFLSWPVADRRKKVEAARRCLNCLGKHLLKACTSSRTCKQCNQRHNTLLHQNLRSESVYTLVQTNSDINSAPQINAIAQTLTNNTHNRKQYVQVFLSTAIINVVSDSGKLVPLRCLLDNGATQSFITENACKKLNSKTVSTSQPVYSINDQQLQAHFSTTVTIRNRLNSYTESVHCLVLKDIAKNIPAVNIDISEWNISEHIILADPTFFQVGEIDMLISADIFWKVLLNNSIPLAHGPILRETKLGWIVTGTTYLPVSTRVAHCHLNLTKQISKDLQKFWETEEISVENKTISIEEQLCEDAYIQTVTQLESGRYQVDLPLKDNHNQLGISKNLAMKRFLAMERRLNQNPNLKIQYVNFMEEYKELHHMSELKAEPEVLTVKPYYIPHHPVFKKEENAKIRVVFDASAKTSSNISLNDVLMKGPVVQSELYEILLRFRKHKCVLTADIKQMYRQILISPKHRHLQRILWRENKDDDIKTYLLNTVTYGLTSSPYLATKTLNMVASACKQTHPITSRIILEDFYVDDLLTGTDDVSSAIQLHKDTQAVLQESGFHLTKWSSNKKEILEVIPKDIQSTVCQIELQDNNIIKTLGLQWDTNKDTLNYKINTQHDVCTKRSILSVIARLYDPLGLVAPIITESKLILQEIWKNKLDWDVEISESLKLRWQHFLNNFNSLQTIQIPRLAFTYTSHTELHVFCDASEKAYGASVYVVTKQNTQYEANLLTAKSRIAPIHKLTIPKLELCAAVLASKLQQKSCASLHLNHVPVYMWTDSTIVLHWINKCSSQLNIYVANRVNIIRKLTNPKQWNYIPTKLNPSDLITRGSTPTSLNKQKLWWHGPEFLLSSPEHWPTLPKQEESIQEKQIFTSHSCDQNNNIFSKYSQLNKLTRIIALCQRFAYNCLHPTERKTDSLLPEEIEAALIPLVQHAQQQEFPADIKALQNGKPLPKGSNISSLNPFLDENGLIRVGGRLQRSSLQFNQKHQLLLPQKHHITQLVIKQLHHKHLHLGPRSLLYLSRDKFWIINGLRTIKSCLSSCLTCFKSNPKPAKQLMGNLPVERVTQARPFLNVGIDGMGPIKITETRKFVQVYILIFICLSTRAIHLEIVSDLTHETIMQAINRFIGRRGLCRTIFSDNAKGFTKAHKVINTFFENFQTKDNKCTLQPELTKLGITWKFIPAKSAHWGGFWEAGVKNVKYHLKRTITDCNLE